MPTVGNHVPTLFEGELDGLFAAGVGRDGSMILFEPHEELNFTDGGNPI